MHDRARTCHLLWHFCVLLGGHGGEEKSQGREIRNYHGADGGRERTRNASWLGACTEATNLFISYKLSLHLSFNVSNDNLSPLLLFLPFPVYSQEAKKKAREDRFGKVAAGLEAPKGSNAILDEK